MRRPVLQWLLVCLAIVSCSASIAFAQGSTKTTLSGVVTDTSGGVIPGATVTIKNTGTGVVTTVVTSSAGAFDAPALNPGIYSVTVVLNGFKTAVLTEVELLSGVARAVKVTLEVGALSQSVEVVGGRQLIQTQSTAITSTLRVDQISNLPMISRNTLNTVVFMPGVDTGASNHSQRSSTISGLPQSSLSITVDGANIQDKYTRSTDGFFVNIHPKLDLIEEVTVSTATSGADASGNGAVQIKFATRSGTNSFVGSAYEYHRDRGLNTNYYFNEQAGLGKNVLTLDQWGGREGGPIVIPGLYDGRGKAFFFFNFEQLRFPLSNTRNRVLLSPEAQSGLFRYGTGGSQSVNLYTLAAANGQTSTPDATIAALLTKIRTGAGTTGIISNRNDPNTQDYVWQPESLRLDNSPGGRVDFNLSARHRLTFSGNYQGQRLTPNLFGGDEPNFPGLVNQAHLYSAVSRISGSLRSTLGTALVNEFRVGISNAPVWFADLVDATQFEDQAGFSINFPTVGTALTSATTNTGPTSRNGKAYNIDNNVNWTRGAHALQFGGSFSRISGWTKAQQVVPTLTLGVDTTNDPANAMFNNTNFPGSAATDLTAARALYALLTGRITQIGSNARLDGATGKYVYLGEGNTREHQDEFGLFIQDAWRIKPTLTFNAGLRWQVAMPFQADDSVYSMNTFADLCGVSGLGNGPGGRGCNLFNPGSFNAGGRTPIYELYQAGNPGYNTQYGNFAPNVGIAWQPNVQNGWLRKLLGDPAQATVRASYGVAFTSDGLSTFTGVYGGNPGNSITTNRTTTSATFPLVPAGESWPILLRQTSRLGPSPGIPASPVYPMAIDFNSGVSLYDPNFKTPFSRSFSFGLQRQISSKMAVEVRYVGTRLVDGPATEDWNEINWAGNGFLEEFKLAQANLIANTAAGGTRAGSFAYFGPGTGTAPLPIYLANFNAQSAGAAGNAALYTGTNWTNTARLAELAARNPSPGGSPCNNNGAASTLYCNAQFRANMLAAGYASNFWVLNPAVQNASVRTNGDKTQYDSLQINMRRALSGGLTLDANYVFARRLAATLDTLKRERGLYRSTQGVPQALKATVLYELPFGQGHRYASDVNRWLDGVIGGWSLNLSARVQTGTVLNFGNVRVVGMTQDELRKAFSIRVDPATKIVYSLPQEIIDNTIKAFSVSATSATGYGALGPPTGRYLAPANGPDCIQVVRGDCAPHDVFVEGPIFTRFDLQARKRFKMGGPRSFDLAVDFLNLFNAINFNSVAQTGSGATINQVNQSYQDPNVTFDPGGRLMQLVFRFNW
ncbi:MAG TPA: carboxypeptidase regulatory-like domain-containing protein [Vicinamibacterales bacterium]|nr:carboxypeptidase regulatory-like domain-containing protein [Vicinamibacterales bacterium]